MRNYYYRKINQLEKIVELPKVTTKEKHHCECEYCIKHRELKTAWSRKRRAQRETLDILSLQRPDDSTIHKDFNKYGPGRYDWDRTTEKDYGRFV